MKTTVIFMGVVSVFSQLSAGNCPYCAQNQYDQGYQSGYYDNGSYGQDYNTYNQEAYYPGNQGSYYQGNQNGYDQGNQNAFYQNDYNMNAQNDGQNRPYSAQNWQGDNASRDNDDFRDSDNRSDFNKNDSSYSSNTNNEGTDDQKLAKKIRDQISGWFSSYGNITVRVNNGDVTLSGVAKNESDKNDLEKKVRNIDGVRSLNSQISVQNTASRDSKKNNDFSQDQASTPSDEQLNKKIREKISEGWFTHHYKEVTLRTNNGVVTVTGFVAKPKDQQDLVLEIRKIQGVRDVNNNVQVRNVE